jgi:glutamate synthase domain-containing protein 3
VLGKCGRNFAAGMSGGIAYVLDEKGDFAERRCNRASVDLDPMTQEDSARVYGLIERHFELTGSPRAKWVIENWDTMLEKFIKIFPQEYKKVLSRTDDRLLSSVPAAQQRSSVVASEAARG